MENDVDQASKARKPAMNQELTAPAPSPSPRLFCATCGHPMEGETCPECGGRPGRHPHLVSARKTIGRLWILLLVSLVLGATGLLESWIVPRMMSIQGIVSTVVLFSFVHAAANVVNAMASIVVLKGPWNFQPRTRTMLLGAFAIFLLTATGVIASATVQFLDMTFDFLWITVLNISTSVATILLVGSIGACSLQDPGGRHRWFLHRSWIIVSSILGIQIVIWSAFRSVIGGNPNPDPTIMTGMSSILWMVTMGMFIFEILFLVNLAAWRRMLSGIARDDEPTES